MSDATFACPDLITFCRLDKLGLEVVGQRLESKRAVLACRVLEPDDWCGRTLKKRAADVLAYFDRPGTVGWGTTCRVGLGVVIMAWRHLFRLPVTCGL